MKKKKVIIVAVIVVSFVLLFLLKFVILWEGVFRNNSDLNDEENKEIKNLVLNAIKDRCSVLYEIKQSDIYDENYKENIVTLFNPESVEKGVVCIFNPGFMDYAYSTDINEYNVLVKVYYPENVYYDFTIYKDENGAWRIKTFLFDV